jgi:hypothetical protein
MNSVLKIVPGHKGVIVGSREDMIQRTLRQSRVKLTTKYIWNPNRMTYMTVHYLPDGTPYNAMTLKNKISRYVKDADMCLAKSSPSDKTET